MSNYILMALSDDFKDLSKIDENQYQRKTDEINQWKLILGSKFFKIFIGNLIYEGNDDLLYHLFKNEKEFERFKTYQEFKQYYALLNC